MTKLDKDYFYEPLTIPGLTTEAVENNLKRFIVLYEEEFMRLLLGDALYDAYIAGLAADPGPIPAKWTALDNQLYKVVGDVPNQVKLSPAANYVYWFYMRRNTTETTASGEKLVSTENATSIGSAPKVKLAWNEMAKRSQQIQQWITSKLSDYPEFVPPTYDSSTPAAIQLYKDRMNILKTTIIFF